MHTKVKLNKTVSNILYLIVRNSHFARINLSLSLLRSLSYFVFQGFEDPKDK